MGPPNIGGQSGLDPHAPGSLVPMAGRGGAVNGRMHFQVVRVAVGDGPPDG